MINLLDTGVNLCRAYNLGLIEYGKALQLQDNLVSARLAGAIPDTILVLQHLPVVTLGVSSHESDIIVNRQWLESKGIEIFRTDRGGGVTFHAPGQLVVYPIFDLKTRGKDLHLFVRNLEQAVIRTLKVFSINGYIDPQYPGVWVDNKKVCALGIRLIHWISKHGLALNIDNDLGPFSYLIPCGITHRQVTSMSQILGCSLSFKEIAACLLEQFAGSFDINIKQESIGGIFSACQRPDIRNG